MTYEQSQKRAQIMRDIRNQYDGKNFLTEAQTALFFGQKDKRDAQEILDRLPVCKSGKKPKYYIGDIATDVVRHTDFK